jgi:CDP-4-dehydro-6-deoxyglucose reductase
VVSGEYEAGPYPAQILAPEELAAGITLLCQARPASDLLVESTEVRLASDIQIRKLPARVQSMERVAPDVAVIKLQLPASETFRFYAGQYIELILKEGRRRSYSMATPPHAGSPLELHVRHMPGGYFTDHVFGAGATQMKEREILRIEGPFGSFFLREDSDKPIVLLASGTGFAPIKAIVEHMIHRQIRRPVALYWGGRRPRDLYMDGLAASWTAALPDFRYVPVISDSLPEDGWCGRTGFVHEAVMHDLPDLSGHQVYACGAPVMVDAARREFSSQCGLPAEEFYADAFTSEADLAKARP